MSDENENAEAGPKPVKIWLVKRTDDLEAFLNRETTKGFGVAHILHDGKQFVVVYVRNLRL